MSGKIFKRAIATLTIAILPIVGLAGTASASTSLYHRFCSNSHYGVRVACNELGVPYVYGGESRYGFDCSGLTQYAVRHGDGKYVPRTADDQYHSSRIRHIAWGSEKPGDLVFFTSGGYAFHVGMVVGTEHGNIYMIAAPYPGRDVRIEQVNSGYWLNSAGIHFGRVK